MKTRSLVFGLFLLLPFLAATSQSNKSTAKSVSKIIIDKLSVDVTLTDKQKDSINVFFDRAQAKARSVDVKDSVYAKEIKLTRQLVMDSILTPEQLQIVKTKNEERQQAFFKKAKLVYKNKN